MEKFFGRMRGYGNANCNTKQPRPHLAMRAGFLFFVETCHGASLRMMGHGITPCCGIRQQYP